MKKKNSGERAFACKQCFCYAAWSLKTRIRTHFGEKTFTCKNLILLHKVAIWKSILEGIFEKTNLDCK